MKKIHTLFVCLILWMSIFCIAANAATIEIDVPEETKQAAYAAINEQVLLGNTEIDVSQFNIPASNASDFLLDYIWHNPEYSFPITYSAYYTTHDELSSIVFEYDNVSTISVRHYTITAKINEIASLINPDWSPVQKLLWINDYACDTFNYNLATEHHTLDKLLSTNEGICEAYANFVTAMCKKINIPVSYCFSNEIQHIWNVVQVDGQWYHFDTTWNDTFTDKYQCMLINTSEYVKLAYQSYDMSTISLNTQYDATSDKYNNAFWRDDIYSALYPDVNGDVYYIKDFALFKGNVKNLTTKKICDIKDEKWPAVAGGSYLVGFNDCIKIGNFIYYNTASTIERLDLSTKKSQTIHTKNGDPIVAIQMQNTGFVISQNADPSNPLIKTTNLVVPGLCKVLYSLDGSVYYVQYYQMNDPLQTPKNVYIKDAIFESWNMNDGVSVNSNMTITGNVKQIKPSYTIKFIVNGEVYYEYSGTYGEVIQLPERPSANIDGTVKNEFVKWDGYTSGMIIDNDYTFSAVFNSNLVQYTIIFYNGTEKIAEYKANVGDTITFPEVPEQYEKNGTLYKFAGWSSNSTTVTQNEVIHAVYVDANAQYIIQYISNGTVFREVVVPAGTVLTFIDDIPTKPATSNATYQFSSWLGAYEGDIVTDHIQLIAVFDIVPKAKMNKITVLCIVVAVIAAAATIPAIIIKLKQKKNMQ